MILTYRHWAGFRPFTLSFDFAESCVFNKQSLLPISLRQANLALLIPKLRSNFAEFLQYYYLERLGTFIPAHQCRFQYSFLVYATLYEYKIRDYKPINPSETISGKPQGLFNFCRSILNKKTLSLRRKKKFLSYSCQHYFSLIKENSATEKDP